MFNLTSQMRRSALSVPSNIAEGSQRTSNKEFANFILIALGSLAELETQFIVAETLRYITEKDLNNELQKTDELAKMTHSFYNKVVPKTNH